MTWSTCHRNTHCWEQDAFAKAIMNRICGQKAVVVNTVEGWNLIRPSLIHLFSWLAENCKGRFPNDVGAAHQAVSGAITAQKKKMLIIAGQQGLHLMLWNTVRNDALVGLRAMDCFITYEGKLWWLPDKYVEFAMTVWEEITRSSEQEKNKSPEPLPKKTVLCV